MQCCCGDLRQKVIDISAPQCSYGVVWTDLTHIHVRDCKMAATTDSPFSFPWSNKIFKNKGAAGEGYKFKRGLIWVAVHRHLYKVSAHLGGSNQGSELLTGTREVLVCPYHPNTPLLWCQQIKFWEYKTSYHMPENQIGDIQILIYLFL